jgi:hypothetical protein
MTPPFVNINLGTDRLTQQPDDNLTFISEYDPDNSRKLLFA